MPLHLDYAVVDDIPFIVEQLELVMSFLHSARITFTFLISSADLNLSFAHATKCSILLQVPGSTQHKVYINKDDLQQKGGYAMGQLLACQPDASDRSVDGDENDADIPAVFTQAAHSWWTRHLHPLICSLLS